MVEGVGLYMLIGAFMFGLLAGATAIVGEEVGAFVGGLVKAVIGREPNEGEGTLEEDSNYVLATDEDFRGASSGRFKYIGSDDCVKIPHVIKGVEVTSYQAMFSETSVSKVISDNPNITDMTGMFYGSKAKELDLSRFDTSKVTSMSGMFYESQATQLDVSSFNTSNVTNMVSMFEGRQVTEIKGLENFNTINVTTMSHMFRESRATELDLSSFDTSNVKDMSGMFYGSKAKTVYARTQEDADKINTSSYKPNGLQVIVKQ